VSYLKDSLSSGEQIVRRFPLHWVAWIKVWGLYLAAIGFPVAGYIATQDIRALYLVAGALPIALVPHMHLKFLEYGLTNRRVVYKKGIVARVTEEMNISRIETVEIKQSFTGRIMGFGNVVVSGVGVSDVFFVTVADPMKVKKQIEEQRYAPLL